jgi:hypothetical protein
MQTRIIALLLVLLCCARASAYVEIPYTLGRLVNESTHVMLVRVEKVDKTKNLIIYSKVKDIKGTHPGDVIKHNIGTGGFHPREWQTIMKWAEPGKSAIFMHNGGASETCIDGYWYQAYPNGEWWGMSHAEPYMNRSYAGKPEKLAPIVSALLAGQEVVVPCMVDGDKNALQMGTAKIQRLKASLKIIEYNATRDFVGWGGNEDFRRLEGMPGFSAICDLPRVDPGAAGIAPADFNGDGKIDFCLYGDARVCLLANDGKALAEATIPYSGGARSAQWADYNGDGKLDLLLATAKGPVLLTNKGETFTDDSRGLPLESYYNLSGAAFADADGDKRPDIVLANGFLGWRVYRNLGPEAPAKAEGPAVGQWYVAGPFDNNNGVGFDAKYAPEIKVDLKAQMDGKGGAKVAWKEGKFTDGQINPLSIFPDNNNVAIYLYREFDFGGACDIPASFGSDDGLRVWLNGQQLIAENTSRACQPDSNKATLKLKSGRNQLLIKITQGTGDFAFYFKATAPPERLPPLFVDASEKLAPRAKQGTLAATGRLVTGDFNNDGQTDLLLCGAEPVVALAGAGGYTLVDSGLKFTAKDGQPALGDFNGDKLPDLYVPGTSGGRLYKNLGGGKFTDITAQSGDLARAFGWGASAAWADLDGNGKPGLLVGCLKGTNRYFRATASGKFVEATEELGFHQKVFNTRGLCVADMNADGALDVLMNNEAQESSALLGNPDRPKVAANK